jgi:DNA (cytosine-5)-methyltransferase 1
MAERRLVAAPEFDAALALELASSILGARGVPTRRGARLHLPRHPQAPDPADLARVRQWVRDAKRPTAIDVFSGAGGLSLGLVHAGFTILAAADSDPYAVETHSSNISTLPYVGDLAEPADFLQHLEAWGITSVDVVAGGVPCQPFSRAGRSKIRSLVEAKVRPAKDTRADLWQSFICIVRALQPRAVVLENVPDLAQWDDGAVLIGLCESLRSLDYEVDARIIRAFDFGVPQHRARLFVLGIRDGGRIHWPKKRSAEPPTVRDAIGDLPTVAGGQSIERIPYGGAKTALQRRLRRGVASADREWVYDHLTRDVRADDAKAFALLPEGGTYKALPADLRRYRSDIFTDKYKRLSWQHLSRTITAHISKDGYWYIHPEQHRTLSIREAARLQTFPDWFRFAGEPTHRFRQIGNAVPPLVAESIGRAVAHALKGNRKSRPNSDGAFREDLVAWHSDLPVTQSWRRHGTPWGVLVGELALTRVRLGDAARTYQSIEAAVPSPRHLTSNVCQAEKVFESLGLGSCFSEIHAVADELVKNHDGRVPDTRERLLALPGVGDYVANAVLCFGFGRPVLLTEQTTERVVSRLTGYPGRSHRWQLRLDLYRLAGADGANKTFNLALLDLGASICKRSAPKCLACPVNKYCLTFKGRVA